MSTIARTKNSQAQALGRGDRSWAATELRLDNYNDHARSKRQVNSSGDSGWAATTMRMQDQATLDEPPDPGKQLRRSRRSGYRQYQTNFSGICH